MIQKTKEELDMFDMNGIRLVKKKQAVNPNDSDKLKQVDYSVRGKSIFL